MHAHANVLSDDREDAAAVVGGPDRLGVGGEFAREAANLDRDGRCRVAVVSAVQRAVLREGLHARDGTEESLCVRCGGDDERGARVLDAGRALAVDRSSRAPEALARVDVDVRQRASVWGDAAEVEVRSARRNLKGKDAFADDALAHQRIKEGGGSRLGERWKAHAGDTAVALATGVDEVVVRTANADTGRLQSANREIVRVYLHNRGSEG